MFAAFLQCFGCGNQERHWAGSFVPIGEVLYTILQAMDMYWLLFVLQR
jgi:hypothetical protein